MNYEPKGKVKTMLDEVARDPFRIWLSPEIGKVMSIHANTVTTHLDAALKNGCIHRRISDQGRIEYRGAPFEVAAPNADLTIPRLAPSFGGINFISQQLEPDMAKSDDSTTNTGEEPGDGEEAQEIDQFDFCKWRDGRVSLWGGVHGEDGSFSLTADQMQELVEHFGAKVAGDSA